ncbi:MAG: hypothetical protein IJE40_02515 [Clostridia bacterium]|nr:hypothetical protein [Clostridia bacterium]
MKKFLSVVLSIAVVVAIIGGIALYVVNTPEFALVKVCLDVEKNGFDAVLPHLTDSAYKKVDPVLKIANSDFMQSILSFVSDEDYATVLIEKAKEIKWDLGEFMKSSEKASVTVGFNCNEEIIGTIDLELVKVDGEWKISDFKNLKITEFSMNKKESAD